MRSTSIAKAEKVEKLIQEGQAIKSACKSVGLSNQTYYQWAEIQRKRKTAEPKPQEQEDLSVSFTFQRCQISITGEPVDVLSVISMWKF